MNTPFVNDPFAMAYQAFLNLYPGKECQIFWDGQIRPQENGEPVYGLTDFGDDGSIMVFVTPELKVTDAVEILAHELAHVAVGLEHDHDDAWEAAFEAIFQEYNRIGDEMFGSPEVKECASEECPFHPEGEEAAPCDAADVCPGFTEEAGDD